MIQATSKCLVCDKSIHHGRSDKKFCAEGCRTVYNNAVMRQERADISIIDSILKHNRRLLKQLLKGEAAQRVTKEYLVELGFRFDFYTHHFQNHRGDQYCFCYDFGYLMIKNDLCLIVKCKAQQ